MIGKHRDKQMAVGSIFDLMMHRPKSEFGLVQWVSELRPGNPLKLEIVKRSDKVKGFYVLPRRWVVERTFGWLGRHRRLSKYYEYLPETSENMIRIAMIKLMARRLAIK